jgi:hypothetical protein
MEIHELYDPELGTPSSLVDYICASLINKKHLSIVVNLELKCLIKDCQSCFALLHFVGVFFLGQPVFHLVKHQQNFRVWRSHYQLESVLCKQQGI